MFVPLICLIAAGVKDGHHELRVICAGTSRVLLRRYSDMFLWRLSEDRKSLLVIGFEPGRGDIFNLADGSSRPIEGLPSRRVMIVGSAGKDSFFVGERRWRDKIIVYRIGSGPRAQHSFDVAVKPRIPGEKYSDDYAPLSPDSILPRANPEWHLIQVLPALRKHWRPELLIGKVGVPEARFRLTQAILSPHVTNDAIDGDAGLSFHYDWETGRLLRRTRTGSTAVMHRIKPRTDLAYLVLRDGLLSIGYSDSPFRDTGPYHNLVFDAESGILKVKTMGYHAVEAFVPA